MIPRHPRYLGALLGSKQAFSSIQHASLRLYRNTSTTKMVVLPCCSMMGNHRRQNKHCLDLGWCPVVIRSVSRIRKASVRSSNSCQRHIGRWCGRQVEVSTPSKLLHEEASLLVFGGGSNEATFFPLARMLGSLKPMRQSNSSSRWKSFSKKTNQQKWPTPTQSLQSLPNMSSYDH